MTDLALAKNTTLLIIDDAPLWRNLIRHMLDNDAIVLLEAESIDSAWKMLSGNLILQIDLILLDRKLPDGDGLELMTRLKTLQSLKCVPVIIHSELSSPEDIQACMEQGAYHYLEKPYRRDMLRTLIRIAVKEWREHRELTEMAMELSAGSHFLDSANFHVRTPADVRLITPFIAQFFPHPKNAVIGISELLINAIEHGNLEIDSDMTDEFLNNNSRSIEVQRRLSLPEYQNRKVHIRLDRFDDRIQLTITDEGSGFTRSDLGAPPETQRFDLHDWRILLAQSNCFDHLAFHGKGNVVCCWSAIN